MAKWGEGDPRWIVEDRPDATNVNNWHWTERNACQWSIDKLKELFNQLVLENEKSKCTINEIEKCEGEAVVNNRKGKLIFFYEWDIILKWKGFTMDKKILHQGTIHIPNLSEENSVSEIEIEVSLKSTDDDSDEIKKMLLKDGKTIIQNQLQNYIVALKKEFSKGMILPKKDEVVKKQDNGDNSAGLSKKVQMNNFVESQEKKSGNVSTTSIKFTQSFQCTGEEIYRALTTIEMVQAFTHGPVTLEPKKGGKFEFFGGNIFGEFLELVPNKKIVQRWRLKKWPENHFSTVTFDIDQKNDHTEVKVVQTNVPLSEADVTRDNWDRYYWEAIKRAFGFGSFIL